MRRIVLAVWIGALLCLVMSLAIDVPILPGNSLGVRRFLTPALGADLTLAQTFKMTADGLRAIELHVTPAEGHPSGDVRLVLSDVTGSSVVARESTVSAASLVRGGSYRFEFSPIVGSKDRLYRFELDATDMNSAVKLWATRGDPYEDGALLANGRPRWADLAFQTFAPTRSLWRVAWSEAPRGRIALGALAGAWILLGLLFRRLMDIIAV